MLPSYLFLRVAHLQRSLSRFTCNTLIEVATLIWVIPKYQPTSMVGNNNLTPPHTHNLTLLTLSAKVSVMCSPGFLREKKQRVGAENTLLSLLMR